MENRPPLRETEDYDCPKTDDFEHVISLECPELNLSAGQMKALALRVRGWWPKEIARVLGVAEQSIGTQLNRVAQKAETRSVDILVDRINVAMARMAVCYLQTVKHRQTDDQQQR